MYQKTDAVMKQNKYDMQDKIQRELYAETERTLPALEYCRAPKKVMEKKAREVKEQVEEVVRKVKGLKSGRRRLR